MEKTVSKRTITETFKTDPNMGGFCGWSRIGQVIESCGVPNLDIFVGLFGLGCRAKELGEIKENQIDLDYSKHQALFRNVYVSKWRKQIGSRTFHINKSEPVYAHLEKLIESTPPGAPVFPYSYNQIYYRIAQIDSSPIDSSLGHTSSDWTYYKGEWWPHRLRAERACQLIRDYGFTSYALKKWFGWRTDNMPNLYGDMTSEDVARLMLKPSQTLHVTPEKLGEMSNEQRQFIIDLLNEQ